MTTRKAITINGPEDRQKIATWAKNVDVGTIVEFRKKTRSNEQNAKLHAMLGEVAAQVVWYGAKLKVEDWKNMFTASLRKAQVVPGIDPGTVVPIGIHTSSMTVDEMSNMIEAIYAFGADPEHLVIFKDTDDSNSNSDASLPPAASDPGDGSPAPPDEGPEDESPSSSSGSSKIYPVDRADLIECCKKLMFVVVDPALKTPQARRGVLIDGKDNWKDQLPAELHDHIRGFYESADAQIKADPKVMPALREKALNLFAELLGCTVEDLEGGV